MKKFLSSLSRKDVRAGEAAETPQPTPNAPGVVQGWRRRELQRLASRPAIIPFCLLVLVTVIFWQANSAFVTGLNISGMLAYAPELGLVALGMTLLLTAGQFDLSVGAVFGAVPLLVFVLVNKLAMPLVLAILIGLLLAAAIGATNGVLVTKFGISSFLVTLSTQLIVGGGALYLSSGFPQDTLQDKSAVRNLISGTVHIGNLTIYAGLIWFLVLALACAYLLTQTRIGNWITASGGNREAAEARGINTTRLTIALFIAASCFAGLAGIISDSRLDLAYPTAGTGYELQAIAIAVVGGTSLFGGSGTITGTLIGALLLQEINNGVVLVGVPGLAYNMFVGAIILIAMLLQSGLKKLQVDGRA